MKKLFMIFIVGFFVLSCVPNKKDKNQTLGNLQYDFDISEKSKDAFDRGLLLLHSFEYEDAREAFEEAIKADESEVMAHWGVAMTYYKALWGLQDVEAGRTAMTRLGSTKEERLNKAKDPLEKDFWQGIELLYGEGELAERNEAYAAHMEKLYIKYEGNQEVAAFYALGLMWSVEYGSNPEVYGKSGRVAAGILKENPNHPGALHYTIHAYDDPKYAELAKKAADKYAKTAPDAVHALHMPSHIYLSLGMWNDVVASNEASYAASVSRMERKGLDDAARGFHSYSWLHYGYLQQGRNKKAAELLQNMIEYTASANTQSARGYLIDMQTAQLIESNEWPNNLDPVAVEAYDLGLTTKARQHFFRSWQAYSANKAEVIGQEIDTLYAYIKAAELVVTKDGIAMCSAGPTRYAPNEGDIKKSKVIIAQMEALQAILISDDELVEEYLKKATALESEAGLSFGPADITYPSFEQYGDWLLTKSRAEEALVQFDKSLKRAPKRAKALMGKMQALQQLDRAEAAENVQNILSKFREQELVAVTNL